MNDKVLKISKELYEKENTSDENLEFLLETKEDLKPLFKLAKKKRQEIYKNSVYLRGLIEITNNCKNNCFYCGIRKDNLNLKRYQLTEKEILECCEKGYKQGLKTFVLQGGENPFFKDETLCEIVFKIKQKFKDCAVTLSIGEREKKTYESLLKAGADRFLLRHETISKNHYEKLHPKEMSLENRINCLYNLKELKYVVGSGFMVGSPFQTTKNLIADLRFLQKLKPEMIGIGPFIPHKDTPFKNYESGSINLTLRLISILRLLFKNALIPATTSLFSLDKKIMKSALDSGANVIMPNISPKKYIKNYSLYNNKIIRPEKTLKKLKKDIYLSGYRFSLSRGDPFIT